VDRIESVTYHLAEAWPSDKRVQITTDRSARFKLKELANGTSIVKADVKFKSTNDQAVRLNRFIDLRADGPRL